MTAAFRLLSKMLLLVVLTVPMMGSASAPAVAAKPANDALASRVFFPEVRLRKMHLVRPDLIPYPIFFNIYC